MLPASDPPSYPLSTRPNRRAFMWKGSPFSRIPPLGLDVQLSVALSRHCSLVVCYGLCGMDVRHCRLVVLECGLVTSEHTAQPAIHSVTHKSTAECPSYPPLH